MSQSPTISQVSAPSPMASPMALPMGALRRVHHLALNVKDMGRSRQFYGKILGLEELVGEAVPSTLKALVEAGKVANFRLPDGGILDLFWEPELEQPNPDPTQQFLRMDHLAFDIAPQDFDQAIAVLAANKIAIANGPVTRPTGRGVYFYDPDGFMVEIRCDPAP